MSAARPSDGLLPAEATLKLIELVAKPLEGLPIEKALCDFIAISPVSRSRVQNTFSKLMEYGIFARSKSEVVKVSETPSAGWRSILSKKVAEEYVGLLASSDSLTCLSLSRGGDAVLLDTMTMPSPLGGLKFWVAEFGLVTRRAIQDRYWTVEPPFDQMFLNLVRSRNSDQPRGSKSAKQLEQDLRKQAELGEQAEVWVLKFERRRLKAHPLVDQVRRVSTDDVGAGYDIASFSSESSLNHDLFIEVKSHGSEKRFHWSRNEIATALEFGEEYALYLVDRTRMEARGYIPHVIRGPTPEMFSNSESGWDVEPTTFEHVFRGSLPRQDTT